MPRAAPAARSPPTSAASASPIRSWGVDPGVGIYLDDVYIARPQGALLDVFDVEPHRSAARPAGHAVRQEHHRRRHQVRVARLVDRDRGLCGSRSRQLWRGRFQGRDRRQPGQQRAHAPGRGQPHARRLRREPRHRRGRERQGHQGDALLAGFLPGLRKIRRQARARLHQRHLGRARRADADHQSLRSLGAGLAAAGGSLRRAQRLLPGQFDHGRWRLVHHDLAPHRQLDAEVHQRLAQVRYRDLDRFRHFADGARRRACRLPRQAAQPGIPGGLRRRRQVPGRVRNLLVRRRGRRPGQEHLPEERGFTRHSSRIRPATVTAASTAPPTASSTPMRSPPTATGPTASPSS